MCWPAVARRAPAFAAPEPTGPQAPNSAATGPTAPLDQDSHVTRNPNSATPSPSTNTPLAATTSAPTLDQCRVDRAGCAIEGALNNGFPKLVLTWSSLASS